MAPARLATLKRLGFFALIAVAVLVYAAIHLTGRSARTGMQQAANSEGGTSTTASASQAEATQPQLQTASTAPPAPTVPAMGASSATPPLAVAPGLDTTGTPAQSAAQSNQTPLAPTSQAQMTHPSFDCSKARSLPEQLICSDQDLADQDNQLAQLYLRAKAAAPDRTAFVRESRAAWNWRERHCTDKACLLAWYADRAHQYTNDLNRPVQRKVMPLLAPTYQTDQEGARPAAPTYRTSFNCSAAVRPDERTICSDPGLAAMDVELASLYAALMRSVPDPARLGSEQAYWQSTRIRCGSDLNCLRHAYGMRIGQLHSPR
jgi:uncharacterized protein